MMPIRQDPDPQHWFKISVVDPDPGSGAFLIPDPGSQIHIFESLLAIFWVKSSIIL
jgi:hypothetical protein